MAACGHRRELQDCAFMSDETEPNGQNGRARARERLFLYAFALGIATIMVLWVVAIGWMFVSLGIVGAGVVVVKVLLLAAPMRKTRYA